jgi:hypothetical protein
MYVIADAILALRDSIFGTLNGALETGYRWCRTVFPWSAGLGIIGALANPAEAGMMAMYGVFGVPALTIGLGWAYGGVTGGIHAVNEGLKERRYNRAKDAREHAPAQVPAIETLPEPAPQAPSKPLEQPRIEPKKPLLDPKKGPELGLKGDNGPSLAFREDSPGTRISACELQGTVRARCGPQAILG